VKRFTIARVGLVLLVTAVVCLSQAAIASAGGGNSANAHLCQKGGWSTLARTDGSPFASQDDCVSYAAQGGTLVEASQAQLDCQSFGGTYAVGMGTTLWTCNGWLASPDNVSTLAPDCLNNGGISFGPYSFGQVSDSSCRNA
jgi:hypothetical protein